MAADDIDRLSLQAATLRERAEAARRLAREIDDDRAVQSLNEHAADYEEEAAALEARIAVLKQAAAARSPENIAAVKPPPAEKSKSGES
jgi:predicted  nucleic acid-binding Zn-ribbon protein